MELIGFYNLASAILVFVYGAIIGSFLNVVIYRLPLERSIVAPGSACFTCGTPLSWWENIPIFSYLLLRGKCRTCGTPYSCRYALIEALCGFMAVAMLHLFDGVSWAYIYHYAFFAYLVVVFFMDLDNWIILDSVSLTGFIIAVVGVLWGMKRGDCQFFEAVWLNNLASTLIGAVVGAGFFWAIQVLGSVILRQEAMGSGDIKLAAVIGAFMGWQYGLLSFVMSFVLGAITALVLMLIRGSKVRDPLPLGTFMAVASMAVLFYGPQLADLLMHWPEYVGL